MSIPLITTTVRRLFTLYSGIYFYLTYDLFVQRSAFWNTNIMYKPNCIDLRVLTNRYAERDVFAVRLRFFDRAFNVAAAKSCSRGLVIEKWFWNILIYVYREPTTKSTNEKKYYYFFYRLYYVQSFRVRKRLVLCYK